MRSRNAVSVPISGGNGSGDEVIVGSGNCGATLTWALDSEGTLTMTATKKNATVPSMQSVDFDYEHRQNVKKLVITGSVAEVGEHAFYYFGNLETVKLPSGVKTIGYNAFANCSSLQTISLPSSLKTIGSAAAACKLSRFRKM